MGAKKNVMFCQEDFQDFEFETMAEQTWRFIREPFLIPYGVHQCVVEDYETFDLDVAGCRKCGRIHRCSDEKNCVLSEHNGYRVCEITGCCVRHKIFSDNEFIDTVAHVSGSTTSRDTRRFDVVMIARWVEEIFLLHTQNLLREQQNNQFRRTVILTRILKYYKSNKRVLNMVDALTCLVNSTSNLRDPVVMPETDLQNTIRLCVDTVSSFCCRFAQLQFTVPSSIKMQGFVVGVLYLMRRGFVMFDTVQIVPRVSVLEEVLPVESSLKHAVGVNSRVMTETENIIKKAIKHLSVEQLRVLGFC